jgi:hypothetical protein
VAYFEAARKMKFLSESNALERLSSIREAFRESVNANYGFRAKDCLTCDVQGVCCTDEHFVNVRITRLEAAAITRVVDGLDTDLREIVLRRIEKTASKLDSGNKFYSCPLYQKGIGCLVHTNAKPMPCIFHACYESKEHMPPDHLLDEAEGKVNGLNRKTYCTVNIPIPIPAALSLARNLNSTVEAVRQGPSSDKAKGRN